MALPFLAVMMIMRVHGAVMALRCSVECRSRTAMVSYDSVISALVSGGK